MKKELIYWLVAAVLACVAGIYYGTLRNPQEFDKVISGDYASLVSSERLIIYTQVGCAVCEKTKKYFDENQIKYEERNITENKGYRKEYKSLKIPYTPITVIDKSRMIIGHNPNLFKKHLQQKGKI